MRMQVSGVIPREELTGSRDLGNDLVEVTLAEAGDKGGGEGGGEGGDEGGGEGGVGEGGVGEGGVGEGGVGEGGVGGLADDTVLIPFVPQIVVDIRFDEGVLLIDPPP